MILLLASTGGSANDQPIQAIDATGQPITLTAPARRVITLAPNLTEILFAAGAGAQVKGVVDFSNYPPQAQALPHVGSFEQFDLEKILSLNPDLIVAWQSGNPANQLNRLKKLGLPLFITDQKSLEEIANDIEKMGYLTGTQTTAAPVAARFRAKLSQLQKLFSNKKSLAIFYQVWHQPLMTINQQSLINDVIQLCGGRNIFANLETIAPTINIEAVLTADPEVIVASGMDVQRPEWLDAWRRWKRLKAVVLDNLFFIPPDLIQRHGPRMLEGAEILCHQLEQARQKNMMP
ncbi:MAG: cobalamin-binding protein [Magnetococcus sp. DMHC-6]